MTRIPTTASLAVLLASGSTWAADTVMSRDAIARSFIAQVPAPRAG